MPTITKGTKALPYLPEVLAATPSSYSSPFGNVTTLAKDEVCDSRCSSAPKTSFSCYSQNVSTPIVERTTSASSLTQGEDEWSLWWVSSSWPACVAHCLAHAAADISVSSALQSCVFLERPYAC